MAWLPQRTNANVPWTPIATPTTSTASTVSGFATPMSSVGSTGSTSSQLSTATVQRPAVGLQTALPTQAQLANANPWGRGRRKSKKAKKTRGRRKSRRGGFTKGAIPYGKQCVFPDSSMVSETRMFTAGELVCYREPVDVVPKSAKYVSGQGPQAHVVERTLDDTQTVVPWFMVGKLVPTSASSPGLSNQPSGTGASGQPGATTGSWSGPLLTRSDARGIGGIGGRKSRGKKRTSRRRLTRRR